MSDEILALFEGLDSEQLREFRRRLVPALTEIRNEIINGANKISHEVVFDENTNIKSRLPLQVVAMKSDGE